MSFPGNPRAIFERPIPLSTTKSLSELSLAFVKCLKAASLLELVTDTQNLLYYLARRLAFVVDSVQCLDLNLRMPLKSFADVEMLLSAPKRKKRQPISSSAEKDYETQATEHDAGVHSPLIQIHRS